MKQLLSFCIILILITSCKNKNNKVTEGIPAPVEDYSVNAEIIETGDIGACNCIKSEDYYYNRVVRIMVKNNSDSLKSFWIMTCSWQESFRCDIEDISFLPRDCNGNFPIQIKLQPKQEITFNTILGQKQWSKSKSFRIGLCILAREDFNDFKKFDNPEYKKNKKTYWSNPISLDLKTFG
jgi:hypothetical protein